MTKLDEIFEKEIKEAVEDTEKRVRAEDKTEIVDRHLIKGYLTHEQIADVVSVTLDFVLERAGQKTA